MDEDKDNANPIVLDASELPSRRADPSKEYVDPSIKYLDGILAAQSPMTNDIFDESLWSDSEPEADSTDSDRDELREEIDEQEIYG